MNIAIMTSNTETFVKTMTPLAWWEFQKSHDVELLDITPAPTSTSDYVLRVYTFVFIR